MKFCSNCGNEVLKESKFCSNCGKEIIEEEVKSVIEMPKEEVKSVIEMPKEEVKSVIEMPKEEVKKDNQVAKQSNPLAITGFVISLVSLLCCGGTSWLGLIFSIIGLVESKKKNNSGKGLAIAGIVISAILLVLLFLCYTFVFSSSLNDLLNTKLPGYYY